MNPESDGRTSEVAQMSDDLNAALDQCDELRDRLDAALTREESAVAARARMANAAQMQVVRMERAAAVLLRCGENDEAALLHEAIKELVAECRR